MTALPFGKVLELQQIDSHLNGVTVGEVAGLNAAFHGHTVYLFCCTWSFRTYDTSCHRGRSTDSSHTLQVYGQVVHLKNINKNGWS